MSLRLFYFPTLNGHKVAIALEEMGLDYAVEIVNILDGGQARPEFLAINPNGRIPALVDGDVAVFESAAILQYLGRKTGRFYPADEAARTRIDSWLFWQMAGLGPMSGQVNWFTRAAAKPGRDPAETDLALARFRRETERLFGVLEAGLAGRTYLCGDYSIADMCIWPWIEKYPDNGGGLDAHPHIAAWHARVAARPAVRRALAVGMDAGAISDEVKAGGMQR
ncbi:glutathione S-transferase family protein [Novosphingobium album (ex Liu et al. 2023)]|uniref:Glutathione S-transferase N-terminal domain-containing protein n=1 Tax=Novosphingobium album (ex Liu et al. 2023) TaxID=3031130 RepID=A0ABT5WUG7_9SPHN|nr:glutathione S-transferase N-terminal domain-containing protein [Novosphingobium album (ex Liu et al. 2023)]MDE8653524.1 glutathione S-transferase N-terminal domain-containing protein [Novosphingobium album (ex Liu et al. 2023)]